MKRELIDKDDVQQLLADNIPQDISEPENYAVSRKLKDLMIEINEMPDENKVTYVFKHRALMHQNDMEKIATHYKRMISDGILVVDGRVEEVFTIDQYGTISCLEPHDDYPFIHGLPNDEYTIIGESVLCNRTEGTSEEEYATVRESKTFGEKYMEKCKDIVLEKHTMEKE